MEKILIALLITLFSLIILIPIIADALFSEQKE